MIPGVGLNKWLQTLYREILTHWPKSGQYMNLEQKHNGGGITAGQLYSGITKVFNEELYTCIRIIRKLIFLH